jgi:dihydroorotate dehydrogenase electron transfer subunit
MAEATHLAARVQRVEPAGPRGVTLELDVRLEAQPGQFVMVWLPRMDEKPFSLVDGDPVTLTVVQVGPFSERLQHLRPGDALYLRGPLGHGYSLVGERPLLVGGGSGVASLVFLARRLSEAGRSVTVTLGARTAVDLLLVERFQALGARLLVSTDDGSAGERGLVTDLAGRLLAAGKHDRVYACGPAPMLERVECLCRAYGVPGEVSREAYMRCGTGICGSCDCGNGLLVCRDGPVFRV